MLSRAKALRVDQSHHLNGRAPPKLKTHVVRGVVETKNHVPTAFQSAPFVLMSTIALTLAASDILPPMSLAETELSPIEKRRELLRKAREAAENRAAPADAPAVAEIEPEKPSGGLMMRSFQSSFQPAPSLTETPPPPPPVVAPSYTAPVAPTPAPRAPAKVEAPAPAKPAAAAAAAPVDKKRRGPLPLWLAQLFLLGFCAKLVVASTLYADKSSKALAVAGKFIVDVYGKAEKALEPVFANK